MCAPYWWCVRSIGCGLRHTHIERSGAGHAGARSGISAERAAGAVQELPGMPQREGSKAGKLSLEPFRDPVRPRSRSLPSGRRCSRRCQRGAMPPPTAAPLAEAERDADPQLRDREGSRSLRTAMNVRPDAPGASRRAASTASNTTTRFATCLVSPRGRPMNFR